MIYIAFIPVVLLRFGLPALAATLFSETWVQGMPSTLDPSAWSFDRSVLGFLVVAAIALYAFYISPGGRRLLAGGLPGE